MDLRELSVPDPGYIHVYKHYFQTSISNWLAYHSRIALSRESRKSNSLGNIISWFTVCKKQFKKKNKKKGLTGQNLYGNTQVRLSEPRREKTVFFFCICENKGADQLRGNREAEQRLCFRYTDSTIPLLSKYEISSF